MLREVGGLGEQARFGCCEVHHEGMMAQLCLGDLGLSQLDEPACSAQRGRRLQCLVVSSDSLESSRGLLFDIWWRLLLGHGSRGPV